MWGVQLCRWLGRPETLPHIDQTHGERKTQCRTAAPTPLPRATCDGPAGDGGADGDDAAGLGDDDEDVDDDDDDDDEGDTLGDLLESLGEDEGLDPRQRLQAQYALASMFNQPADELAAKGSRGGLAGGAAGDGEGGSGEGAAPSAPGKEQPPLRGTTGMARRAVAADDEDGGAAPPPMLPRPKPRSSG